MFISDFFLFLLFSMAGTFLGVLTGLIPGLHTNNVAILLLSLTFVFKDKFIYAGILIVSAAISHTFLDIIPSTFIGAPEEDTALAVLPAHSMLMEGKGYDAVAISAKSSYLAIIASFAFLLPYKFLIGSPIHFYNILKEIMPWILISISLIIILTSDKIKEAMLIYFLSGIFGIVIINNPIAIFPALAGLFGASTIILSKKEEMPEQIVEEKEHKIKLKDIASGSMAGGLVAILPGVTSAIATTIALVMRKDRGRENAIAILSAANTATNFFVLTALFIIMKARSGFAIVISNILPIYEWNNILAPPMLFLFLSSIIISATLSFYLTKFIGKSIAKNISKISYPLTLKISLAIMVAMVIIFSGLMGLLIFIVATFIGLFGLQLGVRRSNFMAILLLPLIINGLLP